MREHQASSPCPSLCCMTQTSGSNSNIYLAPFTVGVWSLLINMPLRTSSVKAADSVICLNCCTAQTTAQISLSNVDDPPSVLVSDRLA